MYIIEKPFKGIVQSYLKPDGFVAYTNGMTFEQYNKENGNKFCLVSDKELDSLILEHEKSLCDGVKEITEEDYYNALECLPPERFDGNIFHVCERITGNLVSWYFEKNEKYYTFIQNADILESELKTIFEGV